MSDDLDNLDGISIPRFSWDYEDLSESEHWFLLAKAYLDCSQHLLAQMIKEMLDSSFFHAKVAVALFNQALELFLKGGIVQAGKDVNVSHDLQQLYNHFKNLYPGKKYEFEGDVSNAVRPSPLTPYNEFARYPVDHTGLPWQGNTHIELTTWYKQVCLFINDFERLEVLLKQRYPNASKRTD